MSALATDVSPFPLDPPSEPRGAPAGSYRQALLRPGLADVAVFGVFAAIFAMALRPVVDNDLFWHLATGRLMWATGRIPHADPFSWTMPGRAWIAHEWLTELWLYPLFLHGGYAALMLVFGAVIAATFAVSYRTARRLGASRPVGLAITLLAAVASSHTWGVRPQMLSMLLMAVFLWLLCRDILWPLVPLMALWVNLHGGFIFGLVLVGIFALGRSGVVIWERLASRPRDAIPADPSEDGLRPGGQVGRSASPGHGNPDRGRSVAYRGTAAPDAVLHQLEARAATFAAAGPRGRLARSWLALALCTTICLANPNGLKGLIYPFTYLGNNASTRYIAEWVSPDFHQLQYQFFEALLLALLAGALLAPRRLWSTVSSGRLHRTPAAAPLPAQVMLILAFTHLALDSVRNINLFAVIVAPFIAAYLSLGWREAALRTAPSWPRGALGPRRRARVSAGRAALNGALMTFIGGAVLVASAPGLTDAHNVAVQARRFPAGAVAYLRRHRTVGPMLNSYDWGGYLIWTLYPRVRVYVDGRPDMYGDRFMDQFVRTWQAQAGWRQALVKRGVRLVLVEPSSGLGKALARAGGWRIAYRDAVSVLYERTG